MAKQRASSKRLRGDHEISAMDVANLMQAKRTNDGTKQNYKSKITVLTKWMSQHQPHALDDHNNLIIPVDANALIMFFGELCAKAAVLLSASDEDALALPPPMSVSAVRGYSSAVVDLYKSRSLKLDQQLVCMSSLSRTSTLLTECQVDHWRYVTALCTI